MEGAQLLRTSATLGHPHLDTYALLRAAVTTPTTKVALQTSVPAGFVRLQLTQLVCRPTISEMLEMRLLIGNIE